MTYFEDFVLSSFDVGIDGGFDGAGHRGLAARPHRDPLGLPEPECRYGYTMGQLRTIMGERLPAFHAWFAGQTGSICDGREYDHEARAYKETGCGPHGAVVYSSDVRAFLAGRPVLD